MTDADRRDLLQALNDAASAASAHAGNLSAAVVTGGGGFGRVGGFNGSNSSVSGVGVGGGFNGSTLLTGLLGNATSSIGAAAAAAAGATNASGSSVTPSLPEEQHYWVLVMLLVPALTIFGNVLVVLAVCRERSLQSATNYFIVSLAFADILVAAIVMPVSVVVEVQNGHWDYSTLLCDLWIMCDALFSTASILNLVAISIDRFIAVTQPIKYSKHKNSKRSHYTIAVTWLLSIGIALPIGCGLQNMQGLRFRQEFRHVCTFFNGDFLIYSSLGSFYIPCIVMLVLYYRIFTVIRRRAQKAGRAKKLQTFASRQKQQQQQPQQPQQQPKRLSNDNHVTAPPRRPQTLPALTPAGAESCLACQTDGIYTGEEPVAHTCNCTRQQQQPLPPPPPPSFESPLQLTESQTLPGPSNSDNSAAQSDAAGDEGIGGGDLGGCAGSSGGSGRDKQQQQQQQQPRKQQLFQQLKMRKKSASKAERSAARREKKATKTLAIVLGVFLFCWVPFFITNLMWAACLKNFDNQDALGPICQYDRRINVFIVWLGYVNSFLNPLIYTIFNTEFRKAFKKLLHIA